MGTRLNVDVPGAKLRSNFDPLSNNNWKGSPGPTRTPEPWAKIVGLPDPRCDPYLIWFDLTYEEPDNKNPTGEIDILVELPDSAMENTAAAEKLLNSTLYCLKWRNRTGTSAHGRVQKFICGSLPISRTYELAQNFTNWGIRFEMASARYVDMTEPGTANMPPSLESLWKDRRWDLWAQAQAQAQLKKKPVLTTADQPPVDQPTSDKPLVVVIDDFCNHASLSLRGRVHTIWHQGQPEKTPAVDTGLSAASAIKSPLDEYYGVQETITPPAPPASRPSVGRPGSGEAAPGPADAAPLNEYQAYARYGITYDETPNRLPPAWTHGSAVLSLLARQTRCDDPRGRAEPDGLDRLERPDTIDFVQLPDVAVLDTSGGSLCGYALDAIHRAVKLACHQDSQPLPAVIVNLSFGTHSGPHDGTSMFERALVEMLNFYNGREVDIPGGERVKLPKLHVVLPAGNTHMERTHASAWLRAGEQHELKWMIQPDTETDSFLELWIGDFIVGKGTAADVTIELELPSGETVSAKPIEPGQVGLFSEDTGSVEAVPKKEVLRTAVIYPKTTSKGKYGTMALIAVAPTQRRAEYGQGETYRTGVNGPPRPEVDGKVKGILVRKPMEAPAGCWKVRLKNRDNVAVQVHAWIQRHDAAPGRRRASKGYQGRQSYFVEVVNALDEADNTSVNPRYTLNGIATASCPGQLWVVGAMDERGGIPGYSAAGPDRVHGKRVDGPDVAVTVDRSRNAPGRLVGGVYSGSHLRLSGTSMGAAAFTRMLYDTIVRGGVPSEWCEPDQPARPYVKTAETPAMADDDLRGKWNRLAHAKDRVIRGNHGCGTAADPPQQSCPDPGAASRAGPPTR